MADFVIDGTGVPSTLSASADMLRAGRGRLALMSYYNNPVKELDLRPFMDKGVQLANPHPAYSADLMDDMRRAVALINNGTFVQDEIISHTFTLDEIQEAFDTLTGKPETFIKGVVYPND